MSTPALDVPLRSDHFEAAEDGHGLARLIGTRCAACGRTEFPPLDHCPGCGQPAERAVLGPDAVLAGFTTVLHPPPGARIAVPYTLAVAAFEGNLSVLGVLVPYRPYEELEIGASLETIIDQPFEGATSYAFRLSVSPR